MEMPGSLRLGSWHHGCLELRPAVGEVAGAMGSGFLELLRQDLFGTGKGGGINLAPAGMLTGPADMDPRRACHEAALVSIPRPCQGKAVIDVRF